MLKNYLPSLQSFLDTSNPSFVGMLLLGILGAVFIVIQQLLNRRSRKKTIAAIYNQLTNFGSIGDGEGAQALEGRLKKDFDAALDGLKFSMNERNDKLFEKISDSYRKDLEIALQKLRVELENKFDTKFKDNSAKTQRLEDRIIETDKHIDAKDELYFLAELDALYALIQNGNYNLDHILGRVKNLIKEAEKRGDMDALSDLIYFLTSIYYQQFNYKEVIKTIKNYEQVILLGPGAYINAALTGLDDYHRNNSLQGRAKALEYLDKSLMLISDYGESLALKLQLFMVDYSRAETDRERQRAFESASKVFDIILNNDSPLAAVETIERIQIDLDNKHINRYLKLLDELFPDEMILMHVKAKDFEDPTDLLGDSDV